MWVLAPLPGLNAASQAAEAQPQHQTIYLTASGEISIGRPLKKGSTVGKADILIFNEQSVSSIHATLRVEAAAGSSQQDGDFTHGSLSITDISRFGTFLTRDGEAAEQKLPSKAPVTLQDGDVLKFGSHTRYRVQQQSVVLVASTTCQDQHPQLQSTAATLNCHLTTSWPSPAAAAAVTEAAEEQEGGSVQAYCVVQPAGELLTPALLRALTTEGAQVLVTPAWLEAVAARRAWPGELPSPNQQPEHRPVSLLLPGQAQQQQQQLLQLSSWSKPDPELLSGYMLVFGKGCQDDLAAAAAACGATTLLLGHHRGRAPTMATLHKQAAQAGQRAILIHPSEAFQQQQQQQRKQRTPQKQQAGKAEQLASLSEVQLLLAVEQHSAEPLQQVTDAFAAEHNQQQQPASPAPPPPPAAAAAAAGGSQGGDETEADVTEGEEEQEQDGGPAAAGQATPPPAAAGGGTAAAGAGDGADAALRGPVGLLPVSPAAGAGATQQQQQQPRPAVSTAGLTEADGWHTHAPSSSTGTQAKTQGRTAGSKRGAAELTAAATAAAAEPEPEPAAAATPSKRGRTAAAGASPTKSALTVKRKGRQQQQAQPGPGSGFDVQQGSADGAGVQGLGTGPEQQQGQQGLGCSTEVVVPLCVTTPDHQPPPTVAVGGGPEVPNYKAFRRRGEAQQQQQQQQVVVVAIDLVAADAAHLQGPDIDAFLRDEQHRQDRLRKADELFHAHLKPIKAPAAAAAAGGRAAGKTAAAAGRGRKK